MQTFEKLITSIAYVIVAGLLVCDVLARELVGGSIWGAQKMAVLAAVAAAFAGFALVTHADAHLRVAGFDSLVPGRWTGLHRRLGDLLSFALHTIFAVAAAIFVWQSYDGNEQVAVLYLPMWPFQLVLVYAFASSAIRHLVFAIYPSLKPEPPRTVG
ncbi:MAG: TRAP transporter small permease subunit [Burkholderiaceae bacterium]